MFMEELCIGFIATIMIIAKLVAMMAPIIATIGIGSTAYSVIQFMNHKKCNLFKSKKRNKAFEEITRSPSWWAIAAVSLLIAIIF